MRVVVNATPLIALALLDRLELLRQMFDEILVPAAVYEEVVVKGAGRPGADAVGRADWLQVDGQRDAGAEPGLPPAIRALVGIEIARPL
jgi:predicted nucleic acid-binding protein